MKKLLFIVASILIIPSVAMYFYYTFSPTKQTLDNSSTIANFFKPEVLIATDDSGKTYFTVHIPATFKRDISAPNIVYSVNGESGEITIDSSLEAGDGISIDGRTIVNRGILTLVAGTGITVDGSTITNSGITSLSAGTNISIDGNTITNTYSVDLTESGWTDSGTAITLTTTTDTVTIDTITFGNATITNGKSFRPDTDLGSDLGSSGLRFNNLWVANINSNSSQAFSGQTTFSYAPTDTTISEASVIINPTTSAANGQLLGLAIAGYQRALIDEDGDIILGYSDAISAPASDYPLNIYGHSGTRVSFVDTSGNAYFSGNVGIGTTSPDFTLEVNGGAKFGDSIRFLDFVTVESYGAVGDGSTDDAAAIQSAIDAMEAVGGGTVKLKAGKTYAVGTQLTIDSSNVTLLGHGAIIQQIANSEVSSVLLVTGISGTKISDVFVIGITVDANYGNQVGGNTPRGVYVKYAKNVLIDSVKVKNAWVSIDFSTGAERSATRHSYVTEYYNDGFEVSGTPASSDEEPEYITFTDCHTSNPQADADNAWEIEDGANNISVVSSSAASQPFVIRNHAGSAAQTENIYFHGCTGSFNFSGSSYAEDPVNYVRNVTVVGSKGIVEGDVENLSIVNAEEVSLFGDSWAINSVGNINLGGDVNTYWSYPATDELAWTTNGAELLRMSSSGNIGIGTTNPSAKLEITSGAGSKGLIIKPKSSYQPNDIPGLEMWFKADAITGLSDGDSVTTWPHSVGSGLLDMTQADSDKKPTYQTNELNSKPVVRFDGLDDYLDVGEKVTDATEGTVFAVFKGTADSAGRTILGAAYQYNGNDYWKFQASRKNTSGVDRRVTIKQFDNDIQSDDVMGDSILDTATFYIATIASNDSEYFAYIDGSIQSLTVNVGNNNGDWWGDTSSLQNFTMGAWYRRGSPAADLFEGDIAEVIVYSNYLSDTDRQKIEGYLSDKYNISVSGGVPAYSSNLTEWQDSAGNKMVVVDSSGNVGIGDETPTEPLTVAGDLVGYAGSFFNDGSLDTHQGVFIQGCLDANPTSACNFLELRDGDGGVVGAIEGNGSGGVTFTSGAADHAEFFDGDRESLSRGDILGLDNEGKVVKATPETKLIGAYSSNPLFLGNWKDGWEEDPSLVPVGLLGQLKVNVSTDNGVISKGDPVGVSSTEPGVGVKAISPQRILGYALEDTDSGMTILVYTSPAWYEPNTDILTQQMSDLETELLLLKSDQVLGTTGSQEIFDININEMTTLNDVVITGKLDVLTLKLDGTNNSIDAIGILKIQPLALDNIEFLGGLVTMSPTGNVILKIKGGIQINTEGKEKPVCSEEMKGTQWFVQGASGYKDSFEVCAKDNDENYQWRILY